MQSTVRAFSQVYSSLEGVLPRLKVFGIDINLNIIITRNVQHVCLHMSMFTAVRSSSYCVPSPQIQQDLWDPKSFVTFVAWVWLSQPLTVSASLP
jgi:hypothetical protein